MPNAQERGGENLETIYPSSGLHPSTTHLELNNADIMNDFIHNIKGEILEESDGEMKYRLIGKPLMNGDGLAYVVSLISGATSRDKILADLDEAYINDAMRTGMMSFILLLTQKWEQWDIDKATFDEIVWLVEHTLYANMSRARLGNTLNQIAQINRDVSLTKNQPEVEKESWMKKFTPW